MNENIDEKLIERVLTTGITEAVGKIVDEEAEAASQRVIERVTALKTTAAQNILTRMKVTRLEDFRSMSVKVVFDVA